MIFANCFIAIPLPKEVAFEIRSIQESMDQIIPSWEVSRNKIPHLTIYYLDSQKEEDLIEIAQRTARHLELLRGEEIILGGIGCFTEERPKVLFLRAEYSTRVDQFYRILVEELAEFRNEDTDIDFYGHVTLGRLRTQASAREFFDQRLQLERLCGAKRLSFPIRQVGLYVLDDESQSTGQKLWRQFEL
jgi:2'-5' RNA ligase